MATCAVLGLAAGWVLHPAAERLRGTAPMVGWLQGAVLFFVAAVLWGVARHTSRTRDDGVRLEAHRAVNRRVLARACSLGGSLVAGGHVGYADRRPADPAGLAGQRRLR
jgi:hypothetical protein